jgi:hypothetical protein
MKEKNTKLVPENINEYQYLNETGPALENWLYLIHHVHAADKKNKDEELHHCPMLDHLGNKYQMDHVMGKDGKMYHCITGLMEDQKVYWSENEAIEDGQKIPCADRQLKKN